MVSHKRSTLHEYFVKNPPFWFVDSARAQGCSEPRGEDLGMNYSSDAHFAREGRSMWRHFTDGGKKNVALRRSNFRKGIRKTNQVRLVTVRLEECCKVILGGLKHATCYEAVTLKVVCPLHSTEIVVFFQHYWYFFLFFLQHQNFPISWNRSEGRAGARQFSEVSCVSVWRAQWQIDNPFSHVTFATFWVVHLMFNVWILWFFQGNPC